MAPEQAEGHSRDVGPAADIYSLGAILYVLLTGRPPFRGTTLLETLEQVKKADPVPPSRLQPGLPRDVGTIALKCLEKAATKRYSSADELAEDLRRFSAGEPIRARPVGVAERLWRWSRRNPAVAVLALTTAVLLISVATIATIANVKTSAALRREAQARQEVERRGEDTVRERDKAHRHLYHSLVGEARALRLARGEGYRRRSWELLRRALELETPDRDRVELRHEAVACLGDFVGLEPTVIAGPPIALTVALHPRTEQVAIGMFDGSVQVSHPATGAVISELPDERSPVSALAFGADGRTLVIGHRDGLIRSCEPQADGGWVCVKSAKTDPGLVSISLTPGGRRLGCYAGRGAAISIRDLDDETSVSLESGEVVLSCLTWSPEGGLLAGGYSGTKARRYGVLVWDIAGRQVKHDLQTELGPIYDVSFSPDGQLLGCAGEEGLALFDRTDFRRRKIRGDVAYSFAFSPDNRPIAFVAPQSETLRLLNTTENREIVALRHPIDNVRIPHSVTFDARGRFLAAVAPKLVRVWNLAGTGEKLLLAGHDSRVTRVAFSPDGKLLASCSKDRTVKFWDPATGSLIKTLRGFRGPVETIAFSPDGRMFATGTWDTGDLRIWEVESLRELAALDHDLSTQIWSVAFSPDGRLFAAGGREGLMIWQISAAESGDGTGAHLPLQPVSRPTHNSVVAVRFSPDSHSLAWAQNGGNILLWDLVKSCKHPGTPTPGIGINTHLDFGPRGENLVYVNSTRAVEMWDVASHRTARSFGRGDLERRGEIVLGKTIALNSSGTLVAVQLQASSQVALWDAGNGRLLTKLPDERSQVVCLAWGSNEALAVGLVDGGLVLWNIPRIRSQLAAIGLDW